MKWADFYEKYPIWEAYDPNFEMLDALEDVGPADQIIDVMSEFSEEGCDKLLQLVSEKKPLLEVKQLTEILSCCDDYEDACPALVQSLLDHQVNLNVQDVIELAGLLEEEEVSKLVHAMIDRGCTFTGEDVTDFADMVDEETQILLLSTSSSDIHYDWGKLIEIMDAYGEDACLGLIENAMASNERITVSQLVELCGTYISDEALINKIVTWALTTDISFQFSDILSICECLEEKTADQVVLHGLNHGWVPTPSQIVELDGFVSQPILNEALLHINKTFTIKDIETLDDVVDDRVLRYHASRTNPNAVKKYYDDEEDEYEYADEGSALAGFISLGLIMGEFNRWRKGRDQEK